MNPAISNKTGGRSVTRVVHAAYMAIAARGTEMEDKYLDGLEEALRDLHSLVGENRGDDAE